ncbi:Stp1/IreP family PP2C-type Ser/Thr phosphatase [Natroniella sulfidigena]|uniref:Stp1/IreP family PP2C-type Ser/Thr phosphatase n=1 Tax=Natroniella sulfidigena TaxID=723921 RepID=UPI00200ADDCC|nr:Stp1/IreP family PP2C-type Ser/Thr phosphatase [Natroniella sulfidigena]MCK8817815.1 Stp1/IreP family PP2C-type Ser/Thr phosphatase [Natroniella sulfidigena]
MSLNYGAVSDRGKVRVENEDDYLVLLKEDFSLLAVADGMGGHNCGELASSLTIEVIKSYQFSVDNLVQNMRSLISQANQKIYHKSEEKEEYYGMGTTLTLGVIKDRILTIGHIGDSRAYLFRNGDLSQITQDHSMVEELIRKKIITSEEAEDHPQKNMLTNALGVDEDVNFDLVEVNLEEDDLILLCSDGLTNMLSEEQIIEVLAKQSNLQQGAETLVELANQAGGRDNITVIIYAVELS